MMGEGLLTALNTIGIVGLVVKAALDHASARALEAQRKESLAAIEVLKAQLTLEAEVRRRVATLKVDALVKIAATGKPLISKLFGTFERDVSGRIEVLNTYFRAVDEGAHFFDEATCKEMLIYAAEVESKRIAWQRDIDVTALSKAEEAAGRFLALVRRELSITSTGSHPEKVRP
jgi:hypothetical protein